MVIAKITPLRLLRPYLGEEENLGSVEKGKKADIIGVSGNPLEDISVLENVVFVMKDGKIYKNETNKKGGKNE